MNTYNRWLHVSPKTSSLVVLAAASLGIECALAVPDTDTATGGSDSDQISEITVTANRRAENQQIVPLAITAVTAESAAQLGITDSQSLASAVPGLNYNRQGNGATPFLRGVGTTVGEVGDEPSVALYVDDVYIPAGTAAFSNFSSIDRIEVEKGPQGTLFGRNATGGVVQVYTKNPTADPAADVTVGYGNYDTKTGSFYVTGGIVNNLAANLSVYGTQQSDGWGYNYAAKTKEYTSWDYGGRAKLLWTPWEATSFLLTVDHDSTKTQEGAGFQPVGGTGSLNPIPPFPNNGFGAVGGFYNTNQDLDSGDINRQSGVSLKAIQDLSWTRLVSISAWRQTKSYELIDQDVGPVSLVNVEAYTFDRTWTQELQLQSPASSETKWIAGAYYFRDMAGYNPLQFFGGAFAPLAYANSYTAQQTNSWSFFGQATQAIWTDTHLTLGVRYTSDHKQFTSGEAFDGPPTIPFSNSPQSANFSKITDRIILDHQFTDDILAYIGYNRGFKSGLFNPIVTPGSAASADPVQPEVLDAYTIGGKTEFLDHRLRVNAEAFLYKYKNIQINEIFAGATVIANAAAATIKGIDFDITAKPITHLTVAASIEVLHGRYTSAPNVQFDVYNSVTGGNCTFSAAAPCTNGLTGAAVYPPNYNSATGNWDLKGNTTVQSPPFSSSLSADYEMPSSVGQFDVALGWNHTGNYYADADNGLGQVAPSSQQNDKEPTINLINASVGWTSTDGKWVTRAWGKNLTGCQYYSFQIEQSFATTYSPAPPRTYGLTVTRHF